MANKIPIYGELECRTAENIIADAEQIKYYDTNVKTALELKMAEPLNEGTVGQILKKTSVGSEWQNESCGLSYCTFRCLQQDTESDARWTHSFSCTFPSNISPAGFLKNLTFLYNVAGHYIITTLSTGKDDTYIIRSIQYLENSNKLRVTILDRDGSTWYDDLDISKMTFSRVNL